MKKTVVSSLLWLLVFNFVFAGEYKKEVKPVKNVILMIPDGTSIGVVSASRWYKNYNGMGDHLYIDPYMCGTVTTFSVNAPIGDSAPTTSCYMTGIPQQAGNVAIYPEVSQGRDLFPLDPSLTYQPLMTLLEAARIDQNKSTGLVVTVEFPHATPADCAAHHYNRGTYKYLASQMAHNNLDVMFGGGNKEITEDIRKYFEINETVLVQDDLQAFRNASTDGKLWALFGDYPQPYHLDRNPDEVPSLEEMTRKALDILSKNDNGFFLMVEGSKVDWAAHANDVIGCISEYIAFDDAVGAVMDFAEKNGETAVVILPDHGNSGFTIGRRDCHGAERKSLGDLFDRISQYKKTSEGLEQILLQTAPEDVKAVFKQYTAIDLTDDELKRLLSSQNYKVVDYTEVNSQSMRANIVDIMNANTCFGFTTGSHTGEEVFLAAYHPNGDIPLGRNTNTEIHKYMFDALGLKTNLLERSKEIYAKHTDVFNGYEYSIDKSTDFPVLKVKKGKNTLEVPSFKSIAYLNGNAFDLGSVTVYIDKNDMFYLPAWMVQKLQ